MNIGDWIQSATEALKESGCPDPAVDARWIAEDVLKMSAPDLRFESMSEPDESHLARLNDYLKRRVGGESVQYILKRADFMGQKFYVDDRVLIPRQDTETLVEAVIIALNGMKMPRVLDLCAGSGAIGLSVKTLVPGAELYLSDISLGAIEVIHKNAHDLNVDVTIRHGDLFKAVAREKFDLIASNPPYVRSAEMESLQKEVQREPKQALDGGLDGLDFYRRIAHDAPAHLLPGGRIYLEVGAGEAQDVHAMLCDTIDCAESGTLRDLNGIERVVWARSN